MVAHTPNPSAITESPGAPNQPVGPRGRRLSGGWYALVVALAAVGSLWLGLVSLLLAYGGISFFSFGAWVGVAAAVLATPWLLSYPRSMSAVLSAAAAGVLVIAGFSLGDTTNVGSSGICSDDLANAVARVPDGYWTTWVLVGGLTGIVMVVGAFLTPRAVGAGLLGVGGWALAVGAFILWVFLNGELKGAPASFPVRSCGEPLGFGWAIFLAAPVALLALAAVIPAIWARPSTPQTKPGRTPAGEPWEEALWRW